MHLITFPNAQIQIWCHFEFLSQGNTHLIEKEDEVDCKGDKESQQAHIIKIPCKVILGKKEKCSGVFGLFMFMPVHANWSACKHASLSVFICVCRSAPARVSVSVYYQQALFLSAYHLQEGRMLALWFLWLIWASLSSPFCLWFLLPSFLLRCLPSANSPSTNRGKSNSFILTREYLTWWIKLLLFKSELLLFFSHNWLCI